MKLPKPPKSATADTFDLHDLNSFRIHEAMLVSNRYDSFILNTDGIFEDTTVSEYEPVTSWLAPRIRHTITGRDASNMLDRHRCDVLMTGPKLSDMPSRQFITEVKSRYPELPVIMLAHATDDLDRLAEDIDFRLIDNTFIWSGDASLFFTIAKIVEDSRNVGPDTRGAQVRVLIVVEDNPRDYSFFLPILYSEIFKQNRRLITDAVSMVDRITRLRARPKVLLAKTYEEAMWLFDTYRDSVMGIISDVGYPVEGRRAEDAGFRLAERVRRESPHLPLILWSDDPSNAERADAVGVSFMHKRSDSIVKELRGCLLEYFGFGDFVFRTPDGRELMRARSMRELRSCVRKVAPESLDHHARNDHFNNWLFARGEFELAARIKPYQVEDFHSIDELRRFMVEALEEAWRQRQTRTIPDFDPRHYDPSYPFVRMGSGSMGGKARGLAFVNTLLAQNRVENQFPGTRVLVPKSLVISSEEFVRFTETDGLGERALACDNDDEVRAMFLAAEPPESLRDALRVFIENVREPLAVRSSSLFEDSQDQPFAGLYDTWFLPNNDIDDDVRLDQLIGAIKVIFASTFFQEPKAYFKATAFRIGQEKMSIVIQELIGRRHDRYFYPDVAGTAQSYNFYPFGPARPDDGIANLVLGLGTTAVDGGISLRVCPRYPESLPQFGSAKDMLRGTQKEFTALDLENSRIDFSRGDRGKPVARLSLPDAERHGTLTHTGSVYSANDDALRDGIHHPGARLVSFANLLKHDVMPIGPILDTLLRMGDEAFAGPIEMEFAVRLRASPKEKHEFYVLQMRPFLPTREFQTVDVGDWRDPDVLCSSIGSLGNGRVENIRDVVFVRPSLFDKLKTQSIADEIGSINETLAARKRPYLLIGMGRWGTRDPSLGIPVQWNQISAAEVIVEANLEDFLVEPSAGSHFFHNITACKKGYVHVEPARSGDVIDWAWLESQPCEREGRWVRHVTLERPLDIRMDGRRGVAVIRRS